MYLLHPPSVAVAVAALEAAGAPESTALERARALLRCARVDGCLAVPGSHFDEVRESVHRLRTIMGGPASHLVHAADLALVAAVGLR